MAPAGDLSLVDTVARGELQFFVPGEDLELFEGSRSGGGAGTGRLFPFATMSRIELCCNLIMLYGVESKGFPWLLGAFEKRRSFTSIGNLQEVIKGLLTKDASSGIYHMGDDEALSTNELIEVICSALGKKAHIWNIPRGLMTGFAKIG